MKRNFTSAQLATLLSQLQMVFETAEVTEAADAPKQNMAVGHVSRLNGVDCVLTFPVTVDGVQRTLRLTNPASGTSTDDESNMARELKIYRDDMDRDFISGVYNRRYWETMFCRAISAHVASGQPVAAALIKVDNYAEIVRQHGQPVADQLVCYVANLWKKFYDEGSDKVVCRLTGHTFAVGCVGAEETDLENQMRVLYEQMNLTCVSTVGMMCRVPFTLSIACAGTDEVSDKIWPEMYAVCDQRLRKLRAAGGNGVYQK